MGGDFDSGGSSRLQRSAVELCCVLCKLNSLMVYDVLPNILSLLNSGCSFLIHQKWVSNLRLLVCVVKRNAVKIVTF